jgi:hypothetical protein
MDSDFAGLCLRFNYKNWRGEEHEYLIDPEPHSLGLRWEGDHEGSWVISGRCLLRDGEQRPDWPRRTFKVVDMKDVEEVEWTPANIGQF